ncbi:3-oxoacyl-ACP reductase FabG [Kitasatospora cathayae]|uniref:3-oxoacyl-ACP reductase FabG n=1 Tax=Kitasatospora cathayae TaxID=3004092 RepID=A0ABY7Q4X5_9ACTN|nr:3-oxoacyl-ACP reductase FabG [Kitasatospora sp. HUAS 3-15]WBP87689.1 3-oxoacyl-ACP reductase FabG [Kitasatospora sp. HUAS 3-15]
MSGVALISGGSRGIGRAAALRLAAEGHAISFCYQSDRQAADLLAKELTELGVATLAERVDVTDAGAVRAWVTRTEQDLGPITVAVASAGITRDKPLLLMADEDWQAVTDTNLTGTANLCRAVAFPMVKRRAGSIITLSSVSGVYGNPGQSNYAASKAGIIALTRALAKEVGRYGVRVNAVAPGMIETDMTSVLTDAQRTDALKHIPLGRFGTADEVADSVAFLAGPRSAYLTGSVLQIDGGIVL